MSGIRAKGCTPRIVRLRHTADTSFLGLSAARLAGSGVGIGIQAKGTSVIHQRDRLPHHNLELFSNAPITKLDHYRRLGENAAAYALGETPEPVVVPTKGEAMGSRFHAQVALIYAIETELTADGAAPENDRDPPDGGGAVSEPEAELGTDYPLAEKRPDLVRTRARQETRRPDARRARSRQRRAGGSAHHARGAAPAGRDRRSPPAARPWRAISSARRNWSTCRRT